MPDAPDPSALDSHLYAAIVEQVAEAVVFADCVGVIRVWNRGAERLFGFTAAEAVGASLDLMIPERLRAAHWSGFNAAIARGATRHGAQVRMTRAVHKDGRRLYVDMSFAVVVGPDGRVAGSVAVARDATERQATQAAHRSTPGSALPGDAQTGSG